MGSGPGPGCWWEPLEELFLFLFLFISFFSEEFLSSDPGPSQACGADLPGHFRADVSLVKKPQVCPVPASV